MKYCLREDSERISSFASSPTPVVTVVNRLSTSVAPVSFVMA